MKILRKSRFGQEKNSTKFWTLNFWDHVPAIYSQESYENISRKKWADSERTTGPTMQTRVEEEILTLLTTLHHQTVLKPHRRSPRTTMTTTEKVRKERQTILPRVMTNYLVVHAKPNSASRKKRQDQMPKIPIGSFLLAMLVAVFFGLMIGMEIQSQN